MKKICILAFAIIFTGCSITHSPPNLKLDIPVNKTTDMLSQDQQECKKLAENETSSYPSIPAIGLISLWGSVFMGPAVIFVTMPMLRNNSEIKQEYSEKFRDCLTKRGYNITKEQQPQTNQQESEIYQE